MLLSAFRLQLPTVYPIIKFNCTIYTIYASTRTKCEVHIYIIDHRPSYRIRHRSWILQGEDFVESRSSRVPAESRSH